MMARKINSDQVQKHCDVTGECQISTKAGTHPGLCTGASTMLHKCADDVHLILLGSDVQCCIAIL